MHVTGLTALFAQKDQFKLSERVPEIASSRHRVGSDSGAGHEDRDDGEKSVCCWDT